MSKFLDWFNKGNTKTSTPLGGEDITTHKNATAADDAENAVEGTACIDTKDVELTSRAPAFNEDQKVNTVEISEVNMDDKAHNESGKTNKESFLIA